MRGRIDRLQVGMLERLGGHGETLGNCWILLDSAGFCWISGPGWTWLAPDLRHEKGGRTAGSPAT